MAESAALSETILSSPTFRDVLAAVTQRSLIDDIPAIAGQLLPVVDWDYALRCASALTAAVDEPAIDAALRIVQGCLSDEGSDPTHRQAAALLLERMGNRRAATLAAERDLVDPESWAKAPVPLALDVIRRRLELSIPISSGETIHANRFQRHFWSEASEHGWLSVSAPTSAGKSYIVKKWIEERVAESDRFSGVYLVPTRALIEEVSRDLKSHFGSSVEVFVLPWDHQPGAVAKEIYVLTQERLHLLQNRDPGFASDLLFVDEAQKLGDGSRGVLLQRVLDEAIRRRTDAQVIFASPSSRNPELLLEGVPPGVPARAELSEEVTVNQNLLWANPNLADSSRWEVELISDGEPRSVGHVELAGRTTQLKKRLPLVALAIGGDSGGNVVYVNGAAEAEETAIQIAGGLSPGEVVSSVPALAALQTLVKETIHGEYRLTGVLGKGVAFHYGNMPALIRTEIERLFKEGTLRYLVCTSTLLEGVNLPCRNLFARGPKRGKGKPMSIPDFWNLAGRAGRWGQEFRGNVVCVDTDPSVWPNLPRNRKRQPISRASDQVLSDLDRLEAFIASDSPSEVARTDPLRASVFSFLAIRVAQGTALAEIPGVSLGQANLAKLESKLERVMKGVRLPVDLVARHPGISPTAMQVLLDYFRGHKTPETLLLYPPESKDSRLSYAKALSRSRDYLGADFRSDQRCAMLAILIRDWMRGYSLRRLIEERIDYQRGEGKTVNTAKLIRETMDDVEEVARFSAPKYLACYLDVHQVFLAEREEKPLLDPEKLTLMLELGVSRFTDVSLIGLGLSRTTVLALAKYLFEDELGREQALAWLREAPLDQYDLTALAREEIEQVLKV
jgi:DEAD/DEAH box helicase/Helicase conserved C-terminal domain